MFRARMVEDEPAIVTVDGVITYRALINAVEAAVEALGALDLSTDTLVALDVKNHLFHIALDLALGLRGVPSASIQSGYSVQTAGVTPHVVLSDSGENPLPGSRAVRVSPEWFVSGDGPGRRPNYKALLALAGFRSDDALVRVAFSSGTTGIPKAVAMRYRELLLRMGRTFEVRFPGGERQVCLPAMSIIGFYTMMLNQFCHGYLLCLAGSMEDMIHLTRLFQVGSIALSVAQAVPMLKLLEGKPPLASLKTLLIGGSRLSRPLLRELQAQLCPNVLTGYASTEAAGMALGTGELLATGDGYVGYVVPGVELQVVDADEKALPAGETGIVRVKTDALLHYLNPTPETQAMYRDGWFYPGDVGSIDKDGLVSLVGRTTEIINRGGAIVAPEYVEDVMRMVRGIRDVAVFGVQNAMGIEEIWAAVVADDSLDPQTIVPQICDRLADKVPDRIVRTSEVPREPRMGKVLRGEVKKRVLAIVEAERGH